MALLEAFRNDFPNAFTHRWSLTGDCHPVLGPFINRLYLRVVQKIPGLWNALYDNQACAKVLRKFYPPPGLRLSRSLRMNLEFQRLDIAVCTHALALSALAFEKGKGRMPALLVGALTDYAVHDYWISPQVDLYLVPTKQVKQEMIARGVEPARIRVTGIPIHEQFNATPMSREKARKQLGLLPNLRTILVAGGSKGIGPLNQIVYSLSRLDLDLQIIVLCGINDSLYKKLQRRISKISKTRFLMKASTPQIIQCLSAADIYVGKAGGVSLAEALATGAPSMILMPLPGQEERNAAMLDAHGAARIVRRLSELPGAVAKLLQSPKDLADLKENAQRLARPDAAQHACREIALAFSAVIPTDAGIHT
jgi:processive 1,2-diacylglycerol beta-glucosyltransferase